jgi:hypothetical protein
MTAATMSAICRDLKIRRGPTDIPRDEGRYDGGDRQGGHEQT